MSAKLWKLAAIAMAFGAVEGGPAAAAPIGLAPMLSSGASDTVPARWRGRGGGGAELAAGLATGLIIGGLLAPPRYYVAPYPYPYYHGYYPPRYVGPVVYGGSSWEAYCFSRYRSFDPISGTYLGYDGRRHYCR